MSSKWRIERSLTALDRARETYVVSGVLKHAGLTGFQLNAGTSGLTIESLEGPDNAADFNDYSLGANEELIFGQPITQIKLSAGDGVVYNTAQRPAEWFVSSSAGNDLNTGFTSSSQLKTLSKLQEFKIAAGDIIILDDDSVWKEELILDSGITVRRSNTGTSRPKIDASDTLTSWTLVSGQTNSYEITGWMPEVGNGTDADFIITVYEDGDLMTYQDSVANVESNPGSYTVDDYADSTNGNTITIHPTDSGNPAVNSHVYTVAKRGTCITTLSDCTIDGIECNTNINPNGSVVLGRNSVLRNSNVYNGTKHNVFFSGSGTIDNCLIAYNENIVNTSGSSTLVVFFRTDPTGEVGLVRNSTIQSINKPTGTIAVFAHGAADSQLESVTIDNCIINQCDGVGSPNAETFNILNSTIRSAGPSFSSETPLINVRGNTILNTENSTSWIRVNNNGTLNFEGNGCYDESNTRFIEITGTGNLTCNYNSFSMSDNTLTTPVFLSNSVAATINFRNNAMFGSRFALSLGNNTPTLSSDNNIGIRQVATPGLRRVYDNTTYFSLGDWNTSTAFDQNSLEVNPGFADAANGDFTTSAPEVDTLQAGLEYYVAN